MSLTRGGARTFPDYFAPNSQAEWSEAVNSSTFKPVLQRFPREIREHTDRLYYVLRVLDDHVDERQPEAAQRVAAVERWCQHGTVESPEAEVFADLARRYGLAPEPVAEFCKGMRRDLDETPFDTEADLDAYCRDVGGAVGVMLAQLLGASRPEGEHRMAVLGMAMQLTNILRDIDEDLAHARHYIPRELLERHGSINPGEREPLLREQIAKADALYDEGAGAIPLLQRGGRAMATALLLYREILRQIEREGYGRRPGRVVVPVWRRRILLARAQLGT
jgi:phytoene synthase